MKPESFEYKAAPDRAVPAASVSIERNIDNSIHETELKFGSEKYEQKSENRAIVSDVNLTTSLPTPVINDIDDKNTTIGSNPAELPDAKHVDVIEKEWIQIAKKIVSDTNGDPYKQEKAVSELQVNYLKKRYGRETSISE